MKRGRISRRLILGVLIVVQSPSMPSYTTTSVALCGEVYVATLPKVQLASAQMFLLHIAVPFLIKNYVRHLGNSTAFGSTLEVVHHGLFGSNGMTKWLVQKVHQVMQEALTDYGRKPLKSTTTLRKYFDAVWCAKRIYLLTGVDWRLLGELG